jgi:hypothetical protein
MKQSLVLLGTTQQQDPAQAAPELFAQLHQPSLALVLLFISPAYDLALLALPCNSILVMHWWWAVPRLVRLAAMVISRAVSAGSVLPSLISLPLPQGWTNCML